MPIRVPDHLPAKDILHLENIFVMDESVAYKQDIRPLHIVILNIMPTKETTEAQLLRLLGNTPLQVEVTLLHPKTHVPKNTSMLHLDNFYKTFDEIRHRKFDGMIITGAPIEHLEFADVNYWDELKEIMAWTCTNVTSTFHICWGAQAGLYYHYGVPKFPLKDKLFGIFEHEIINRKVELARGFDDRFMAPQSRHTEVRREDIEQVSELEIISESPEAGVYIAMAKNGRQIFVTGHSEYDPLTLKKEYERDLKRGVPIEIPKNYYPENNPAHAPQQLWKAHAFLLFSNWLNYYVYQQTPFEWK